MKAPKIANVDLSLVDVPQNRNVRESVAESYDDPNMRDSLRMFGQQTTAKLLRLPTGRYEPVQGFRRTYNMKILAEQGVIDPMTARHDDDGKLVVDDAGNPVGGRPFTTIRAEVYEGLSELERIDLLIDHGDMRRLNPVEFQYACEELLRVGRNEREVVIKLKGLIEQFYPPTRKIKPVAEDNGADLLKHYRGVIQIAKRVWKGPVVMREAYLKRLRKQQAWPTNSEIVQLYSTYEKEQEAPENAGKFNRQTPGPEFLAEWGKLLADKTTAAAAGKRAKSSSMMGHDDVKNLYGTTDSRILKAMNLIVRRLISHDKLPLLDQLCMQLESTATPEQKAVFDAIFAEFTANAAAAKAAVEKANPPTAEDTGTDDTATDGDDVSESAA